MNILCFFCQIYINTIPNFNLHGVKISSNLVKNNRSYSSFKSILLGAPPFRLTFSSDLEKSKCFPLSHKKLLYEMKAKLGWIWISEFHGYLIFLTLFLEKWTICSPFERLVYLVASIWLRSLILFELTVTLKTVCKSAALSLFLC